MLGVLAYRRGMYDEARRNLALARAFSSRCSYQIGLINSKIAFARIAIFRGKYEPAKRILQGTFRRAQMINYERGAALSAEFLGEVYHYLAQYTDALRYLKIAANHAAETAPHGDIAVEVLRRQGEVLIAVGREKEAEETLIKALEIADNLHDHHELGAGLRAFGTLEERKGNLVSARSYFKESIATFRLIKDPFELASTYYVAANFNGRWSEVDNVAADLRTELLDEARAYAIEGMHLYTSIGLEDRARECRELLGRLEAGSHRGASSASKTSIAFDRKNLVGGILVVQSQHMQGVVSRVKQYAPSKIPILIFGETGTGKELVARLIHSLSQRSHGPFVPVNCATLPEPVFESEVFGHRRGSFTGAVMDKIGLMEQASGGTLLLDEISELSNGQQAKLLRALQEGTIRRVGETRERPVDVRIICASNSNPEELLESGSFRKDLFYRVAGQVIELEPLRRRQDDIPPLFAYYVSKSGKTVSIENGLMELLYDYPWPGNARELVNVVNALLLAADGTGVMRVKDLPIKIRDYVLSERLLASPNNRGNMGALNKTCAEPSDEDQALKELIAASLKRCGGNRSEAARDLGIGRSTLYRHLKELDSLKD
ncbi:MAG: sigma 54-interacting transcriptional regulator [Candidatus Krumholzibacteria bacterium]|nr:sigma 54-interacting transcriptional regulator [Candidatus Krumholzibacteria bacterium]